MIWVISNNLPLIMESNTPEQTTKPTSTSEHPNKPQVPNKSSNKINNNSKSNKKKDFKFREKDFHKSQNDCLKLCTFSSILMYFY